MSQPAAKGAAAAAPAAKALATAAAVTDAAAAVDVSQAGAFLTINVLRIRHLKGAKGELVAASVLVEYGERVLGASEKVEATPEDDSVEVNLRASLPIFIDNPYAVDELAYRPILISLNEASGGGSSKDKKGQAPEKIANVSAFGQCTIDLLPLLRGETELNQTLCVLPSVVETHTPVTEVQHPEVDVHLSLSGPLFAGCQPGPGNIMRVTLESLCSPPEALGSVQGGNFIAAFPFPLTCEKESVVVFSGGQIKPLATAKDPVPPPLKQKKWPVPAGALGSAMFIPNEVIMDETVEAESGDLRQKEEQEFRRSAEAEKVQVVWNMERRCYLDGGAVNRLRDRIGQHRYWPVEIFRASGGGGATTGKRGAAAGGGGKEDESFSFHGVAYVDMAPLIYPGVNRVRGVYKVYSYTDQELLSKTKRHTSIAGEAARQSTAILTRAPSLLLAANAPTDAPPVAPPAAAGPKKEEGKVAGGKDKKGGGGGGPALAEGEAPHPNPEGLLYVEACSYIKIEFMLDSELVKDTSSFERCEKVLELIPPRPMFPKRTNCAEKAVEDFHLQIGSVAGMLLAELRELLGDSAFRCASNPIDYEENRQKLVYELNTSGKYLAFKEQLKHAVVKIVREKYCKTTAFTDRHEFEAFLCELYIYLTDEMHVGLHRVLAVEDERAVPSPLTTTVQLKHFAREAEVNGNYCLAAKYYQERIAREKNDPNHWVDYGAHCLLIDDVAKAEVCFRECVSMEQAHVTGLVLCGIAFTLQCKGEEAKTVFEAAVAYDPCSVLVWTVFGLSYESLGCDIQAEMCFNEAWRLNWAEAAAAAEAEAEAASCPPTPSAEPEEPCLPPGPDEEVVVYHTPEELEAERAAEAEANKPPSPGSAKSKKGGKEKPAKVKSPKSPKSPTGDAKKQAGPAGKGKKGGKDKAKAAEEVVEETPEEPPPPKPCRSTFMQAVYFLLEVKAMPFAERALAHHLLDPLGGVGLEYYLALARVKLQRRLMTEVECNVRLAIDLQFNCVDAWAMYGHMKYLEGDMETARECYDRAVSFKIDTPEMHSVCLRLASIYLQCGNYARARDTFLMACKKSPSCVSWLGVGISCYRMGEYQDAEDALTEANILNNLDPEVWAYLSLVSLQRCRRAEAEQAYKYAMKLNLEDEQLISELRQLQQKVGFGDPSI